MSSAFISYFLHSIRADTRPAPTYILFYFSFFPVFLYAFHLLLKKTQTFFFSHRFANKSKQGGLKPAFSLCSLWLNCFSLSSVFYNLVADATTYNPEPITYLLLLFIFCFSPCSCDESAVGG